MARELFDLAAGDDTVRFSPYCWRIRMALAHKGLDVNMVPVRFTEKDKIAFSGQKLVPVLRDIVYLFAVRPFSRGAVFHYHAGGLPEYVGGLWAPLRFLARRAFGGAAVSIQISRGEVDPAPWRS